MDETFAGICGITKEEMLEQMSASIDQLAHKRGITREQAVAKLKECYDGYHFAWPSPDVFNPYSLLNCMADGKFNYHWFGSDTHNKPVTKVGINFDTEKGNISDWMIG